MVNTLMSRPVSERCAYRAVLSCVLWMVQKATGEACAAVERIEWRGSPFVTLGFWFALTARGRLAPLRVPSSRGVAGVSAACGVCVSLVWEWLPSALRSSACRPRSPSPLSALHAPPAFWTSSAHRKVPLSRRSSLAPVREGRWDGGCACHQSREFASSARRVL